MHFPLMDGKGEALWKELAAASGDLVMFVDSDLVGCRPEFITGLRGPVKGQHITARTVHSSGVDLVLAGPVGPNDPAALDEALAHDRGTTQNLDIRYWCEKVASLVDGYRVRWIATVDIRRRKEPIARATVLSLRWKESGGLVATESPALGAVGYRRGCLPELVDADATVLLADNGDEEALAESMRLARTLDPAVCIRASARRFTPAVMAERYLALYWAVLTWARTPRNPFSLSASQGLARTHGR